jgi:hypothetical protein
MGYKRKLYVLKWPEGHELHGLEVTTKGLPVKKLFQLVQLSGQLTGDTDAETKVGVADELFKGFAERLVSWNLEDDDDAPVPATLEGVSDQDMDFMVGLIMTWMDAVASVDIPLPGASPDGATTETTPDLAASIPVETLSPSPPS